jgi:X-X-X-Leu-X-X-Gly heptad repeat protein
VGTHSRNKGTSRLNNGTSRLNKGTNRLNKGTNRLNKGTNRLNNGTNRLNKGTDNRNEGTNARKRRLNNLRVLPREPVGGGRAGARSQRDGGVVVELLYRECERRRQQRLVIGLLGGAAPLRVLAGSARQTDRPTGGTPLDAVVGAADDGQTSTALRSASVGAQACACP